MGNKIKRRDNIRGSIRLIRIDKKLRNLVEKCVKADEFQQIMYYN